MADISPEAVKTARQSGYSDDEIVGFLAQKNPQQFKAAQDAGYSSKEILDHLGTAKDTSYAGAVQKGVSDVVEGVGKTVKNYIDPETGKSIEATGQKAEPKNYKSATTDFMNKGAPWYDFNWSSAPRALVEQAPGLAVDILAAAAAKKLGGKAGAVVGGVGSNLLRNTGGEAEQRAQYRTGDPNAVPSTEDKVVGAGSAAVQAALNQVGLNRFVNPGQIASTGVKGALEAGKKLAGTAATEGVTEAAQDVVSQVGSTAGTPKGVSVDPKQALGAGALGAGGGAAFGGLHAGSDLNNARRFRDFDTEASQRVANRIQTNAEGDLGNVKTARKAVGATETDIKSDLSQAFEADPDAKSKINADDTARRALARFNAGEQVTDGDLSSIESATSGSPAADRIASLVREAVTLRKLIGMGDFTDTAFKGGLSSKMEKGVRLIANPVGAITAGGAGYLLGTQGAASLGMLGSSPAVLGASGAAYLGARALDKATGYRSPADTFVSKFGNTDATTPAVSPQVRQPQNPTGPSIPLAATVNGKLTTPPWGPQPGLTVAEKRDAKLTKALDTALTRGVDQQNREDARQDASIDRMADFIGRTGAAQLRGDRKLEAMKARAAEAEARRAEQEQVKDATGLMAARKGNLKLQTDDAKEVAQAARANATLDRRQVTEQKADAREQMASRTANAGPTGMDRVQMAAARELTAARRANDKLQRDAERAASEAEGARQEVGSDGVMTPDTLKAAQKLVKSLSAVEKIKARVQKGEAQIAKKQEQQAKAADRAQQKAERDAVKEAKAAVRAQKATKPETAATEAAPKAEKKTNGTAKLKLDEYPEAPWAYETSDRAAEMAYKFAIDNGADIGSPAAYKRSTAKRIDNIVDAFADISKKVNGDGAAIESAMAKMLALRSAADAKSFREVLKDHMPHHAAVIAERLNDGWINETWTPKRSQSR